MDVLVVTVLTDRLLCRRGLWSLAELVEHPLELLDLCLGVFEGLALTFGRLVESGEDGVAFAV